MRIIEVIISPDPEPPEAVSGIGCHNEAVQDNFLMELKLCKLVGWSL